MLKGRRSSFVRPGTTSSVRTATSSLCSCEAGVLSAFGFDAIYLHICGLKAHHLKRSPEQFRCKFGVFPLIDDLHERAGSSRLIHMHGELGQALCTNCGNRLHWPDDMEVDTLCPACHSIGTIRPDVVWFGEMPYHMGRIERALAACDLFVSIGTSGNVYPAAGFVEEARRHGAHTVELNLEPSEGFSLFAEAEHGKATEIVPAFVERLISGR